MAECPDNYVSCLRFMEVVDTTKIKKAVIEQIFKCVNFYLSLSQVQNCQDCNISEHTRSYFTLLQLVQEQQ